MFIVFIDKNFDKFYIVSSVAVLYNLNNHHLIVGHSGSFQLLIPLLERRRYEKNLGSIILMQTSLSLIKYGMELDTKEHAFLKCA